MGWRAIYRNNEFVGTVTSAGKYLIRLKIKYILLYQIINNNDFIDTVSLQRNIYVLVFISYPKSEHIQINANTVTTDFIMDPKARYEIDIAGTRFLLNHTFVHYPYRH